MFAYLEGTKIPTFEEIYRINEKFFPLILVKILFGVNEGTRKQSPLVPLGYRLGTFYKLVC